MPDPKRCEVCQGDKKIRVVTGGSIFKGFETADVPCPSCSLSPLPDEWEKEFEEMFWNSERRVIDTKSFIRSLLLSYGKERERAMWRKCREAVKEMDASLDALNPDKSSPDAGREE